ncbi:hypothetical protein E1292_28315 [Nonomuraea deserti]|uniref:Uncharacterized protein n=1 Tax=Nonomuraea deserti TaxID=1848322 RepID=A0A4R4VDG5_9ACTN|nr:hypothetical protein [Nonomuraea deserti]TDD00563.1 hypothetical protein E1292_28315 [Nonomuraea deserti]
MSRQLSAGPTVGQISGEEWDIGGLRKISRSSRAVAWIGSPRAQIHTCFDQFEELELGRDILRLAAKYLAGETNCSAFQFVVDHAGAFGVKRQAHMRRAPPQVNGRHRQDRLT